MLLLLAEETLHPLADGAGHPERYHTAELLELLDRADVFVGRGRRRDGGVRRRREPRTTPSPSAACASARRFEARGVANQLVDWAEGVAMDWRLGRLVAHIPAIDEQSLRLYRGHDFLATPDPGRPDLLIVAKRFPAVES